MFSSPLQRAIAKGLKPDGDLADELSNLGDYPVKSRRDANAICNALRQFPLATANSENSFTSPLRALAGLFQDVAGRDSPAFKILHQQGLPELIRIFDSKIDSDDTDTQDDLLFVLKILAMYGSQRGAEKIVEAARRPLKPEAYLWHVVLSIFADGHPHCDYLFQSLRDPIPPGFLAVALLDSANSAAMTGQVIEHPFDSANNQKRIEHWLMDSNPEHYSYAHSATAAIPFLSNPGRDQLLAIAMDHPSTEVQLEAAWAAGRLGREAGLKILARFCLDVNYSDVANRYLVELGREDLVPAEAQEPSFQAKAEFARWLAHPNELGRPPDELEIADHRQLAWPPDRELKPLWLIRYRVRDLTGLEEDDVECGLVGSTTWCFFSYQMHQRPPEDAYAIHCSWELENADLIHKLEVTDSAEYASMLDYWNKGSVENATITCVLEMSPQLRYPSRLVALAEATCGGELGWIVLDGPRSTWYPSSEQPNKTHASAIWMIHIGRQLLGFHNSPDRKRYLIGERPRREPHDIVSAYEKLMNEAFEADVEKQIDLLKRSPLSRHFDAYVDSLATVRGTTKPSTLIDVYDRFLGLAKRADEAAQEEFYDSFSLLGEHFDSYVQSLVSTGLSDSVVPLINLFAPYSDHNLGYGRLGNAAYHAGQRDIAEGYFKKLRDGLEDFHRTEEMSLLAEIWHKRGDTIRAQELLTECLHRLITQIKESKYQSDKATFIQVFQHHRNTFLSLFPDGLSILHELNIPESPT